MKRSRLLVAACLLFAGCASYYRVTDVSTGDVYYTSKIHRKAGGAVKFKDGRTGSQVTLQSSQVTKITKEQFTHEGK
jgi:hypothetical protein